MVDRESTDGILGRKACRSSFATLDRDASVVRHVIHHQRQPLDEAFAERQMGFYNNIDPQSFQL
jgi:hypothetical protein